jgi:23S rRNA pseudouridine1911/1915/1917 synthase
MPPIEFLVDRKDAGQTIATVLRRRFNLPWSQVKRVIERGHVRVAGFACSDPGHRVKAKNRVWIREGVVELPKKVLPQSKQPRTTNPPLAKKPARTQKGPPDTSDDRPLPTLVYADDVVAVVDKPAGLTTMRHAKEAAEFGERGQTYLPKTLADELPRLLGRPGLRPVPVHRIDRDTSGLVAFALTPAAGEHLTRQFRQHSVERRYLALVRGRPVDGRIESVLIRDRGDGRRGSATDPNAPGGKRAVTHVRVLEQFSGFALVECRLETGRTHQVRIHLGEANTPLCGERVYDRPVHGRPLADPSGADRPMLHAVRLGFVHPESGRSMHWDQPPPPDFAKLLEMLRSNSESSINDRTGAGSPQPPGPWSP